MKFHNQHKILISELKLDPSNPNELTQEQEKALDRSIDRFGFVYPICYDTNTKIIADGEHRLQRLIEKGEKEVTAIPIEFKDDSERRLFRQTMNKLRGLHTKDKDAQELKILFDNNKLDDLALLIAGNKEEYITLLEKKELIPPQVHEDDFEPPREPKYKIQRGEVWQLGRHRLMCGDATSKEDVDKLMDGKKADLLLTDPPYNVDYEYETYQDNKPIAEYIEFCKKFILNTNTDNMIITIGWQNIPMWASIKPWLAIGIWYKINAMSGSRIANLSLWEPILFYGKFNRKRRASDFFEYIVGNQEDVGTHRAPKPIKLWIDLLNYYSEFNNIILDVFGGSGTTIIACEQTNRICRMMEIDPYYCSIIVERWEKFTGKQANKIVP